MAPDVSFSVDEFTDTARSLAHQSASWSEYTSSVMPPDTNQADDDERPREAIIDETVAASYAMGSALQQVGAMLENTQQALQQTAADYLANEQAITELIEEQLGERS